MSGKQERLRLPGDIAQVRAACDFVVKVATEAGLSDDAIFQSQLSVEEIFTNIVEHGYKFNGAQKWIEITCTLNTHLLRIAITDDAPLFNPLAMDDPDPDQDLWERERGGWGVFFVRQYMDAVYYQPKDGRNQIILEKHF